MEQTNKIFYTTDLRTTDIKSCDANAYAEMCENFNCYEVTPDDRKMKAYFDIELKPKHCVDGQEYSDCWKQVLEYAFKFIEREFLDANCCFKNASSADYKCCATGETKWIISMHVIVYNYLVSKAKLKYIVIKMNQAINKELNDKNNRCEKVTDYIELKKTADDKYDHQFFDEGVYDKKRKIRSPLANKMHYDVELNENIIEDRPMKIVFGTFEQSIITAFNDENMIEIPDDAQFKAISTPSQSPTSVTNIDNMEQNKHIDLLLQVGNNGHTRSEWVSICGWCHCHANRDIFVNFVHANWKDDAEKMWDSMTAKSIPVYWIETYAKSRFKTIYKEWLAKWNVYFIDAHELDDPFKVAQVISTTLKMTLVLCNEKWFMLNEQQLWKQQKEASFYIINELRKYIDKSNEKIVYQITKAEGDIKDKLVEKSKIYLKSYKSISANGFLNVLTKFLKTLLADNTFEKKLDNNAGKLVFKNGIMDLQTHEFTVGIQASDFVTDTIPYAYEPTNICKQKKQFVKDVLLKILNNNVDHLEYFLGLIGFTFIGNPHLEKSIYFCVDKTLRSAGDNGKTFFFDILTTLLPNYVYKTDKSFLEDGNKKTHKQLVMMKGRRLVWADEFNEKKANAELMKLIGDGLQIENEIMFGTSETIEIMFKTWILTNHIPKIDPKETAVYNRYKQISYGSHFDRTGKRTVENAELLQFVADPSLGDLIKTEYKNEVFELVIEYANKYYKSKLPAIPEQFKKDTEATKMKNDEFATFLQDKCIMDETERVALKVLVSQSGFTEKLVKEGMERNGYKYDKDLRKLGKDENNNAHKGGYIGLKLKPEDPEEVEEDC